MSLSCNAARELLIRQRVRGSLTAWAEMVVEERGVTPERHHRLMLDRLEALARGENGRLMLLMPPGAAKSTYSSLIFPAWWMALRPEGAVVAASHTAQLATQFGRGVRLLINQYGPRLGLSLRPDSRSAARFTTARGGEYFGVGVMGGVTGRRADLALIDDPIKSFALAESGRARDALWDWYRTELSTRLKPGGRIALIMTRWHRDDLAGRLIEQGGWEVLRLPALAEEGDPLGRAAGEALWPAWEDEAALDARRRGMGEYAWSALYQQAPGDAREGVFDLSRLTLVDTVGRFAQAVRGWDLAASVPDAGRGDPDWSVGVRVQRDGNGISTVDDVRRFRAAPGDVERAIVETARHDGPEVVVALPQDPGQAGLAQVNNLKRLLSGYRVQASPETGSKLVRARPVAVNLALGTLRVLRAGWTAALLDELGAFPGGRKDDQVDALSRAVAALVGTSERPARTSRVELLGR